MNQIGSSEGNTNNNEIEMNETMTERPSFRRSITNFFRRSLYTQKPQNKNNKNNSNINNQNKSTKERVRRKKIPPKQRKLKPKRSKLKTQHPFGFNILHLETDDDDKK